MTVWSDCFWSIFSINYFHNYPLI
ncbi:hypothetical protein XFF6991_580004 [Xanthomonas phaseoli pv. phaseoli]|uniref:Uncharacterized protein n=1 Tax=Xanthomonas campestris pv. phaseoli TaxID=317013 RepID=A0A7Z7J5X2_XANCH|nr:hypothetical protein XFF6991_580004 [Xanthomonas phaseoli pv. phaseoli]